MNRISSRVYEDGTDIQIILDVTTRVRSPEHCSDFPTRADIEEALASPAVRANTRVWLDNDHAIGWAYLDEYGKLVWELDLHYGKQVGAEMMSWGELCLRKRLPTMETGTLHTNCRENYTDRIEFLKQNGFRQMEETTIKMIRSLSEPIPEPALPPGFIIHPLAGKQGANAVAAMHRAAFGTDYMTTENRLIIMSTSEYDPSLDLVAVAPDGRIAGNCICSANEQAGIGYTDPISIHPQFQRMGLARALLLTGLKLLKERGMRTAYLGTSGENLAMRKTAEAVGFKIEYTTIWFSKEVS